MDENDPVAAPAITPRTVVPGSPGGQAAPVRLKQILRDVPASECHLILDTWEAAVLDGKVKAVPRSGRPFTKRVCGPDGVEVEREIPDELVIADEVFAGWLREQRREARYAVLAVTGEISTDERRLESGEDSFERLLQARLHRLQARPSEPQRRARKPRP